MHAHSVWLLLLGLLVVHATFVPEHVYLSLTGDVTQMQVTFTTTTKPTTASVAFWAVGTTTKTVVSVAAANTLTFTRPVTSIVNYINSVTLTGLKNSQYYYYQVQGDTTAPNTTSEVFKFRHIPAPGQPVAIGVYGDLGAYGYALTQTSANGLRQWAAAGKFDIIIHNGDLAYNLGTDNGTVGDNFMKNIQPITSTVPYICTPGNHEFMNSGQDEKYFTNFWTGQRLLGNSSKSDEVMWFSFDIGTIHIVGISTEVYCEDTGNVAKQYAWLEADLQEAASRSPKPWIIVLGHRPLYSSRGNPLHSRLMRLGLQCDSTLQKCSPTEPCKDKYCAYSIQDLLVKYKVDMFNAGHEHVYQRNNPISDKLTYELHPSSGSYINSQSPLHIISGAAGTSNAPAYYEGADATPEVKTSSAYSFSLLSVYNSSAIHYSQISAENGAAVDEFWMIKNKDTPSFKSVPFTLATNTDDTCDQ